MARSGTRCGLEKLYRSGSKLARCCIKPVNHNPVNSEIAYIGILIIGRKSNGMSMGFLLAIDVRAFAGVLFHANRFSEGAVLRYRKDGYISPCIIGHQHKFTIPAYCQVTRMGTHARLAVNQFKLTTTLNYSE